LTIEPGAVERLAVTAGEHKAVVFPATASSEAGLELACSVCAQNRQEFGRQLERAAALL
jgi:hypothetical protein